MASSTWWTWVWASSGSWWWTGKPGILQSMGLWRVGDDWVTELKARIIISLLWMRLLMFIVLEKWPNDTNVASGQVRNTRWDSRPFFRASSHHYVKWKSLSHLQLLGPHGLYYPWNSPGQNTGVGTCSLLLGIFPTQGSNPGLLHCRWILYQLNHKGSPPFSKVAVNLYWAPSVNLIIFCPLSKLRLKPLPIIGTTVRTSVFITVQST